jgi:basic membrane protein A
MPTEQPTQEATAAPTEMPTEQPTQEAAVAPTEMPTEAPTAAPTEMPTEKPTVAPTATEKPTEKPTVAPTATEKPTEKPTVAPTATEKPTEVPTEKPTEKPTAAPTATEKPAEVAVVPTATEKPTEKPTEVPATVTPIPATEAPTEVAMAEATPEFAAPDLIDCSKYDLSTLKIGLVTDVGQIDDKSFNQSSWEGVLSAETCGASVKYIQTMNPTDYANNIAEFAESGYNIIVTVGYALGTATTEAAALYPDVTFIGVDQAQADTIPNVVGLVFHEDQSGYLAGVLAARLTKTNVIAAVLGTDLVPPVVAFKEGYEAGAKSVNPDIKIISTYHPGGLDVAFIDPEWGAATAKQALDQNADVVFGAGGKTGNGALIEVANHVGASGPPPFCIGVDTDQWLTVPEAHPCLVSSAMKLLDVGVSDIVKAYADNQVQPGNFFGQAALAPFHDLDSYVPADVQTELQTVAAGLADGSITTGYGAAAPEEATPAPTEAAAATAVPSTSGLGLVKVGINAEYPPFEYVDEKGNIVGFDPDLMTAIAQRAGFELQFINTRWDGIFVALSSGEFDAVSSAATITEEREQIVNFSKPYFNAGQMIAVRKADANTIKTPEDLAGKRVGVQTGTTGDILASSWQGVEVVRYDEITLAFQALSQGDVDAVLNDGPTSADIVGKNPQLGAVLVGEPLSDEYYGIAVQPNEPQLLDAINTALDAIIADGTYEQIYVKWFGTEPPAQFLSPK